MKDYLIATIHLKMDTQSAEEVTPTCFRRKCNLLELPYQIGYSVWRGIDFQMYHREKDSLFAELQLKLDAQSWEKVNCNDTRWKESAFSLGCSEEGYSDF